MATRQTHDTQATNLDGRVMQPPFIIPIRTLRGMNDREHPMSRHRRVKREKTQVGWELKAWSMKNPKPPIPCVVRLTRLGPSTGLDDDNLAGALKSVRDAIADWLQINDRHAHLVRYQCAQAYSPAWGVQIEFGDPYD